MSWIKENLFGVALGGATAVVAGGLFYWGLRGSSRIEEATNRFTAAADEVTALARAPLYPSPENRDGKRKALDDYRASLEGLQKKFLAYRPAKLDNIPPAEFGTRVLEASAKAKKALDDAAVKYPENFAISFEQYTTKPAEQGATGILGYQLDAVGDLVGMLAAARPSAILNGYRPPLPEETRGKYERAESEVARPLPFEVVFRGSEKSVRTFLNSLVNSDKHFFIVRAVRVMNQVKKGPTADDAKFETPKPPPSANPFGDLGGAGGFVLPPEPAPEEGTKPATGGDKPAAGTPPGEAPVTPPPAEPAPPPPPPRDSSQVLKQLVGNEEVTVCARIDLMLFHDDVALPGGSAPKKPAAKPKP